MSINTHISKWIEKSQPDFYTMFIKSWIPYNAWYMHNFYDEDAKRTSDKSIIRHIGREANVYKNRIIGLLKGGDDDSLCFKEFLWRLHCELENHPIPDYINKISFSNICIEDNSQQTYSFSTKKYTFKGDYDKNKPKTTPRWRFEVIETKSLKTISSVELFKCSVSELLNNADYKAIDKDEIKKGIEHCLKEIDPNKKISIINTPESRKGKLQRPANSIVIKDNKLFFRDNIEDVSKAIIQILYELRCKLFHGEVEPTNANIGIYEQAFYIQRMLIKELE